MAEKKRFGLSREEMGIVGSYSSFFGLLLIATILSYKSIFYLVVENFMTHIPPFYDNAAIFVSLAVFAILFIIIPVIPLSSDIYDNYRQKNYRLVLMLIFVVMIYVVALLFQMGQVHIDAVGGLISSRGAI